MNTEEFKKQADTVVEWIVDYYRNILDYPVKSLVKLMFEWVYPALSLPFEGVLSRMSPPLKGVGG